MITEFLLSLLAFIVSGYFIFSSFGFKKTDVLAENSIFFPFSVALILFILGILHLFSAIKNKNFFYFKFILNKELSQYLIILLVFLIFLPYAGFLPAAIGFGIAFSLIAKLYEKKLFLLLSFGVPLAVWGLFSLLLKVALP